MRATSSWSPPRSSFPAIPSTSSISRQCFLPSVLLFVPPRKISRELVLKMNSVFLPTPWGKNIEKHKSLLINVWKKFFIVVCWVFFCRMKINITRFSDWNGWNNQQGPKRGKVFWKTEWEVIRNNGSPVLLKLWLQINRIFSQRLIHSVLAWKCTNLPFIKKMRSLLKCFKDSILKHSTYNAKDIEPF